MTPVLRVVMPTANVTDTARHNTIVRGLNSDYITDDRNGNKAIPASALYAARMNASGQVTVARTRQAGITAEHSYLGWPIP
jgi:hypothetical protein